MVKHGLKTIKAYLKKTLFLKEFSLQGKDVSKPAGNW